MSKPKERDQSPVQKADDLNYDKDPEPIYHPTANTEKQQNHQDNADDGLNYGE